jgi:sigma-B regulation protein RsbU (phosphoserine phosphatase)
MKKISIIEDTLEINNLVKKILVLKNNYMIKQYFDGESVLKNLDEVLTSDLIILDVMLPEISGIEIYKKIMTIDTTKKIIFLTAKSDSIDFFEKNNCKYLIKPFDPNELLSMISSLGI